MNAVVGYIKELISEQAFRDNLVIKGFVYNEGTVAEQYMVDKYTPENELILWGTSFKSPFTSFGRGSGIGVTIGNTHVSVNTGVINGMGVLFVHPTSVYVNHEEVEKFFKEHFPDMFFIEHDINFMNKYRDALEKYKILSPEFSKEYIEQVLKDCYKIFLEKKYAKVDEYCKNVSNILKPLSRVENINITNKIIIDLIRKGNETYSLGTYNFYNWVVNDIYKALDATPED